MITMVRISLKLTMTNRNNSFLVTSEQARLKRGGRSQKKWLITFDLNDGMSRAKQRSAPSRMF